MAWELVAPMPVQRVNPDYRHSERILKDKKTNKLVILCAIFVRTDAVHLPRQLRWSRHDMRRRPPISKACPNRDRIAGYSATAYSAWHAVLPTSIRQKPVNQ
ncbi:hypothetical protein Bxe_B1125 [Paraburkholderia xenovorans LB400]|uniref:Uncharacterized protein n=1 Tax=Paraburkholderia xenovorans (strain LB400) TaxID=266265 RepID=Q13M59_PARXL|nr:hypothetical protein Bxe_B1125 [Paraburkholderia xenovorans LB400]